MFYSYCTIDWSQYNIALSDIRTKPQIRQGHILPTSRLTSPGRGPKVKVDFMRSLNKHRYNHFLFKHLTFFPHQDISFNFSDESKEQPITKELDDIINGGRDDNFELRQINLLRQCAVCSKEPLNGIRWHCAECLIGIDLCGDCAVERLETESSHDPSHRLIAIKSPSGTRIYNLDYFSQNLSNPSYNYLDPNFLPE
ncbi:hypothetical protein PUN28_015967 [Cardiocondyla obscurior]|uniref:ZZ-type domain-containing protein n=1 Tax=Cardiocondyla obscurior TaxID=286306 RepID=A0AAW2ES07_9HYME